MALRLIAECRVIGGSHLANVWSGLGSLVAAEWQPVLEWGTGVACRYGATVSDSSVCKRAELTRG